MLSRKLGAALAAGCTVVTKPAARRRYSALAWAVLAEEAGIPAGVINVLRLRLGHRRRADRQPAVKKITFTGSTEVGQC